MLTPLPVPGWIRLSHFITCLSKVDRWLSLEHFQTTKQNPTSLKQGDRFFFFLVHKYTEVQAPMIFVNPPFRGKAGLRIGAHVRP